MAPLISGYEVELVEPACSPGAARWGALISLHEDIGEFLPYLNAKLRNARYFREAQALIWDDRGRRYAFRPSEIRVSPVEDTEMASQLAAEIIDRINQLWGKRSEITPLFEERQPPAILSLYQLLPKTNCRKCGHATCMAFAAALRQDKIELDWCPGLTAENRARLLNLLPRV